MNPWQAVRTLLNPKVHENIYINKHQGLPDGRHKLPDIDVLIPMGPDFVKLSEFRSDGSVFQGKRVPLHNSSPKYVSLKDYPTVQEKKMEVI